MKHKGKITISRPTYSDGRKAVSICVHDEDAGIEFLSIEIDTANFTEALTGHGRMSCELSVNGLDNVGKVIERDELVFCVDDLDQYANNIKKKAYELALAVAPKGWEVSDYFGSQSSFFWRDEKHMAKTNIYRWVEKTEGEE